MEDVFVEGIDGIAKEDLRYGREMGYRLKLLAIAQHQRRRASFAAGPSVVYLRRDRFGEGGRLVQRPERLRQRVGETLYYGRGPA